MSHLLLRAAAESDTGVQVTGLPDVARRLRALAAACEALGAPEAAGGSAEPDASEFEIAQRIRNYLAARRRRDTLLGPGWFADPAWDILLDLLACRHERRPITVSSACIAAAVPATTALRWIGGLVEAGAVLRREDPADRRRAYVELAPEFAGRLDIWVLASLSAPGPAAEGGCGE